MAFRPLGLVDAPVQMRDDVIEQQQKQDACPEAEESREKGELSHGARLFDGGDDQAPDGGRHHHARRKFRKNTQAAPADVPIKGIRSPMISVFIFGQKTPVNNDNAHRTDVLIRDPARSENEDVRQH